MKKIIKPPGFIVLGFLAVGLMFVDLMFHFVFNHSPWPEQPLLVFGVWALLLVYLIVLMRTTFKLRATEADLRRSGEELQSRVEQRTAQLEAANRQLMAETVERQRVEERNRLARNLHDSVAQTLYGISLGINTANTYLETDRQQAEQALDYALKLTDAGMVEMRALIFELHPGAVESAGLVTALTRRVAALCERYRIEVELDLCGEPDIPVAAKDSLYWITQEALQNAVKHAHASRLDVRLACIQEWLTLEVCDNGAGFDPMIARAGHLGLQSMRERAENVGGTLEIVSGTGCGTQIRVRLPLAPAPAR